MPVTENLRQARGGSLALLGSVVILLVIQGCATMGARQPLPAALEDQVQVPRLPHVRAWADRPSQSLNESAIESISQERAAYCEESLKEPVVFLALSGGGDDGAFGAGILCGWSAAGTRPRFKLVTGISTGALIAPFAFLGPEYDPQLKAVYTTVSQKQIFHQKSLLTALWRESLADTQPLAKLLEQYITEPMFQAIAAEHQKGRRLFIGTTQLDAQRLVIWNMGAIAASGRPEDLELFRKILLASASIPAAFPPQYFNVEAGGKEYKEMHVDGGAMAEVILYESALQPFARIENIPVSMQNRPRILYIIRNSQIKPDWQNVKSRLTAIAPRAIDTLIKAQGVGDLYRLYTFARRDGLDYNLAAIPLDFPDHPKEMFDTEYMNKLFNLAYGLARQGYPWLKHPPFFRLEPVVGSQPQKSLIKVQQGYQPKGGPEYLIQEAIDTCPTSCIHWKD